MIPKIEIWCDEDRYIFRVNEQKAREIAKMLLEDELTNRVKK